MYSMCTAEHITFHDVVDERREAYGGSFRQEVDLMLADITVQPAASTKCQQITQEKSKSGRLKNIELIRKHATKVCT